jgi:hypothetical protein
VDVEFMVCNLLEAVKPGFVLCMGAARAGE